VVFKKDFYMKIKLTILQKVSIIKKRKTFLVIGILLTVFFTSLSGCVEENNESETYKLNLVKLIASDLKLEYQELNEEYLKEPYVVEQGKMFEGMKVLEKYEILFYINTSYFIVQQVARLESINDTIEFVDTIKERIIMPGVLSDYYFFDVDMEKIGDDSLLKENTSIIDGKSTHLFMLVFRVNDIVSILASGSVEKEDILEYAKIVENRIYSII